jgi:16S rRNA processing protein RimM
MKALPLSHTLGLFAPGTPVYLHTRSEVRRCTIRSLKKMGRHFIISCHDIMDRQVASLFRGAMIEVPAVSLPPVEGEFLHEEIIGLTAITTNGEEVGKVIEILQTRAHDIYVVGRDEKEYLVPAVREFIVKVLLDEKKIIVRELEGLFD